MQARFLQEGKELLARNKESLAAEMDNASKDEVTITPVFQSPYTYIVHV